MELSNTSSSESENNTSFVEKLEKNDQIIQNKQELGINVDGKPSSKQSIKPSLTAGL